jgi:hypothetical protein
LSFSNDFDTRQQPPGGASSGSRIRDLEEAAVCLIHELHLAHGWGSTISAPPQTSPDSRKTINGARLQSRHKPYVTDTVLAPEERWQSQTHNHAPQTLFTTLPKAGVQPQAQSRAKSNGPTYHHHRHSPTIQRLPPQTLEGARLQPCHKPAITDTALAAGVSLATYGDPHQSNKPRHLLHHHSNPQQANTLPSHSHG